MATIDDYKVDAKLSFAELIVPTPDSVRSTFILAKLLANRYHCMMVGETGTGKTVNISQYLQGVSKCEGRSAPAELMPLTMTFSAQTCRLGVQCKLRRWRQRDATPPRRRRRGSETVSFHAGPPT